MIDKNDPRLTAYLCDELQPTERAEVDAAIEQSAELRRHVDGLRETMAALQSVLAPGADDDSQAAADRLTDQQLAEVDAAAAASGANVTTALPQGESSGRATWRRLAMAALLLYAVGISFFAFRRPVALPVTMSGVPTVHESSANQQAADKRESESLQLSAADAATSDSPSEAIIENPAGRGEGRGGAVELGRPAATLAYSPELSDRIDQPAVQQLRTESFALDSPATALAPATTPAPAPAMADAESVELRLAAPREPVPQQATPQRPREMSRRYRSPQPAGPPQADPSWDEAEVENMFGVSGGSSANATSRGAMAMDGVQPMNDMYGSDELNMEMGMDMMMRGGMAGASQPEISARSPVAAESQFLGFDRAPELQSEAEADVNREMQTELFESGARQSGDSLGLERGRAQLRRSQPRYAAVQPPSAAIDEASPTDEFASPAVDFDVDDPQPVQQQLSETRRTQDADAKRQLAKGGSERRLSERKESEATPKPWKPASAATNRARLSIGQHDDLLLAARDTYVRIDGFRARVMFDLYYYNDRAQQLEGQFLLRLPDDAALHYFAFGPTNLSVPRASPATRTTGKPGEETDDAAVDKVSQAVSALRKQTASIGSDLARRARDPQYKSESNSTFADVKTAYVAPRQKAALAYEETVRRRVDPALVEWAGPGIFQTKVFPLMPGKLHRIVVGYDVTLADVADDDGGLDRLFQLDLPEDEAGGRVEFDIVAAAGTSATITPDTDPFVSGGRAYYRFEDAAPRDYTARLSGTESVVIKHSDPAGGDYFATRVIADLPQQDAKVDSRRAVFLLDTSWSDRPEAFSKRLALLEQILRRNRDSIDQFAVLMFNVQQRWWQERFVANDDESLTAFLTLADDLALEGATDLHAALVEATAPRWSRPTDKPQPRANLFLLSDAAATWGATDLPTLAGTLRQSSAENAGGALFTYPFAGQPSDRAVMRLLADASDGAVFTVADANEYETAAVAHRSRPWKLTTASAEGADEVLIQGGSKTIYPGQPLVVAGRGPLQGPIELVFQRGSESQTVTIDPKLEVKSPAAARLYGGIAVDQLEPYSTELEEITVAFARHFRVPGRTCSMVMLESEQDYQRFGVNVAPEEDQLVIASTSVSAVIDAQQVNDTTASAASRDRFVDWIESLQSASLLKPSTALRLAVDQMPADSFGFLPRPLQCRSYLKSEFEPNYLDELAIDTPSFEGVMSAADQMLIRFGADDAIKVASTLVEAKPSDIDTLRSVAFRALEWNRGDQAVPLLWRIAQARPYQPQCLMLLARALAESGETDSAVVCYELVNGGNWNERWSSAPQIAKVELLNLLEQMDADDGQLSGYARARLRQLRTQVAAQGVDVSVIMHWNTDRTDVDLHIIEPSGEECFYKHKSTASGGQMTADITQGFGPEMYTLATAPSGEYKVQARYFRSDQNRTSAPTEVLVTLVRDLGRSSASRQTKRFTLSGQQEKQSVLQFRVKE
ncbi:VWA domain-containing protein [Stieleria sp. TO1_6]|uniref:VWA domain-containing protein n=1 Tax=Stieleria tagensis TaxID=2956795 RepID=UPI00209A90E6|nr:VWA domain-containing protein [Stieleria tagensis]MCO8120162.1 VWA domain-containing protein [Stieleria tagensis]